MARALRHDYQDPLPSPPNRERNVEAPLGGEGRVRGEPIDFEALAQQKAIELLRKLPELRYVLEQDVAAAFVGDPAAKSHYEIIFCYPGLEAITIYRLAHEL